MNDNLNPNFELAQVLGTECLAKLNEGATEQQRDIVNAANAVIPLITTDPAHLSAALGYITMLLALDPALKLVMAAMIQQVEVAAKRGESFGAPMGRGGAE